jgi:hypothetical protein
MQNVITNFTNKFSKEHSAFKCDPSSFKFVPQATLYKSIFEQLYFEVSARNLHICPDGITNIEDEYSNLVIDYDFMGDFEKEEI